MSKAGGQAEGLLDAARDAEKAGDAGEALTLAWTALDRAPDEVPAIALLVRLIRQHPGLVPAARRADLARLLVDLRVDPLALAQAGWRLLVDAGDLDAGPAALANRAGEDALMLGLLREAQVVMAEAERAMTGLRRWLLLSGRWPDFPRLLEALAAQARHNQGAWLRDAAEQALVDNGADPSIAAAYSPAGPGAPGESGFADAVTAAVADQYRRWPYPIWSRVTVRSSSTLPEEVEKRDGGRPSGLPRAAEILIAGCGTGREAALTAARYPDARITAIDLSEAALAFAAERCAAAGLANITFHRLDLHEIGTLGRSWDFIASSGVLHHLPDPEAGWAALARVLRPGGVMKIMLYSKVARLRVRAAQAQLADLQAGPVDDALLREARRRLLDAPWNPVAASTDFYSLAGVHDLLFHRHEDVFDVPRIVRAIDALGLELLAFDLPRPALRARYLAEHPHDPQFRDTAAWSRLEMADPRIFAGMYDFWCRKPAGFDANT
jgi:SAM-dependent methyltransferase